MSNTSKATKDRIRMTKMVMDHGPTAEGAEVEWGVYETGQDERDCTVLLCD